MQSSGSGSGATLVETGYYSSYAYDAAGNLITQIEYANAITSSGGVFAPPSPNQNDRETHYAYAALTRKISETRVNILFASETSDPDAAFETCGNSTTTFAYDRLGNLISTTDAPGRTTAYSPAQEGLPSLIPIVKSRRLVSADKKLDRKIKIIFTIC